MKRFQRTGASLIALCVSAGVAWADVTPEQVWEDWQATSRNWGQDMTAESTTREGDALIVRNVKVASDKDGATMNGTIDQLTFREAQGGTVEVTASPDYPMTLTVVPEATLETPHPEPLTMKVNLRNAGLVMRASGDPGAVRYDYDADTLAITVDDMTEGGEDVAFGLEAVMNAVEGSYLSGDEVQSTMTADTTDIAMTGGEAQNGGALNYHLKGVSVTSTGTGMGAMGGGDLAEAVAGGMRMQAGFAYDSSTYDFRIDAPDTTTEGKGTSGTGTLNFRAAPEGMVYSSDTADATLTMRGGKIPFPVDLRMGRATSTTSMPVAKSNDPQPFALALRLSEVTASDAMWNAFDPNGALPRDPADIALDLSGRGVMPTEGNPAPDAPTDVTINELLIRLAGAELTGTGEGTVTGPDRNTNPEAPPTVNGTLNLMLKGGNALIDNAIAAGLLPEQQALGARMMLGMFSRPVTGQEDAVESRIEMRNGQLLVNGQRLQ
ncbi:DUF2125 domain-containing protein [Falsirhodobacter halotolerans]|uniref:DUF2125 domain-containing protein n=1 Tax=Falsirhodobacter halotolerans TaxID=1146892 RepID=UPI001FD38665|nr:DUF2125 domain-containing protein [Falsirhodobacter halotolerans]MCJ8140629.1 DUF2125 domain-containing protein [Falsirhodobacter halotolerans]